MEELAPIQGRQGERTDFQSTFFNRFYDFFTSFKFDLDEILNFLWRVIVLPKSNVKDLEVLALNPNSVHASHINLKTISL